MQLKTVVLPAPFGPINAVILCRSAVKSRPLTATTPPKRMVRPSTVRMVSPFIPVLPGEFGGDGRALPQENRRRPMADQTARPPDHQKHHRHAEYQHAVLIEAAEQLKAADQGQRRQRNAEL